MAVIHQDQNNMEWALSSGAIKGIFDKNGTLSEPIVVQLTKFHSYRGAGILRSYDTATIFDGSHFYKNFLFSPSKAKQILADGILKRYETDGTNGDILLIKKVYFSKAGRTKNGNRVVVIDDYELLAIGAPFADSPGVEFFEINQDAVSKVVLPSFTNNLAAVLDRLPESTTRIAKVPALSNDVLSTSASTNHMVAPHSSRIARNIPSFKFNPVQQDAVVTDEVLPKASPTNLMAASSTSADAASGLGVSSLPMTPRTLTSNVPITTPIYLLTPNIRIVRGRCTYKENLDYRFNGAMTKVLYFVLEDESGRIQLSGYGDYGEKANEIVEKFCSYEITGIHVQENNQDYYCTGHQFEIELTDNFEIKRCDDVSIRLFPLDSLAIHTTVDVVAVVHKIEPEQNFVAWDGIPYTNRKISLVDKTAVVVLTIWEDDARQFPHEALGKVIMIQRAAVKKNQGECALNAGKKTMWEISNNVPEAAPLLEWYDKEGPKDVATIDSILDQRLWRENPWIPKAMFVYIKARIQNIDKETKVYPACLACGKNLRNSSVPTEGKPKFTVFNCGRCNQQNTAFTWKLMELKDHTAILRATVFEGAAEKVFGKPASEIVGLMKNDDSSLSNIMEQAKHKTYIWKIDPRFEYRQERSYFKVIGVPQEIEDDTHHEEGDNGIHEEERTETEQ